MERLHSTKPKSKIAKYRLYLFIFYREFELMQEEREFD